MAEELKRADELRKERIEKERREEAEKASAERMENQIQHNQQKKSWVWLLVLVPLLIFIVILAVALSNSGNQTYTTPGEKSGNPSPPGGQKEQVACTSFEYSNWSHCATDGTQNRNIIKALPEGCSRGNPIQIQKCDYKPVDYGTAPEIYRHMVDQIRSAPNQSIETSYISDQNGELTQKLSYRITDNSLIITSIVIHRATGVAEPKVYFTDADLDGFVDYYANEDGENHALDKQGLEYLQVQKIWGIYLVYFASYLLK